MGHFEKNKLVFLSIFNKRPQFLIKKKVETKSFKNTIKIFVKIFRFPFNVCGIFEYQTILLGKKNHFVFVQKILTLMKISMKMFALV